MDKSIYGMKTKTTVTISGVFDKWKWFDVFLYPPGAENEKKCIKISFKVEQYVEGLQKHYLLETVGLVVVIVTGAGVEVATKFEKYKQKT